MNSVIVQVHKNMIQKFLININFTILDINCQKVKNETVAKIKKTSTFCLINDMMI